MRGTGKEPDKHSIVERWRHHRDVVQMAGAFPRIVGDVDGRLVVASPLYKQHFDLITGECLEDDQVSVATYSVTLLANQVQLSL